LNRRLCKRNLTLYRKEPRTKKIASLIILFIYFAKKACPSAPIALNKKSAIGADGISAAEYGKDLSANLDNLLGRMKEMSYRPKAVKRVYIPKLNGKMRPLGIPSSEDKIVQLALTKILSAIYEEDFIDNSYGFRLGRSCHDALKHLNHIITNKPVSFVIDADIKGFIDHNWLVKFLQHRISDRKFVRYVEKFLKAGIMEDGKYHDTEEVTPQGGILSPVLANIYLHYVLDLWVEIAVKRKCTGYVEIIRYADDFIICVQRRDEAEQILAELKKRLEKFGLELFEEKTRLIKFGRFSKKDADKKGDKPATFNFLGFTHFVSLSLSGKFKVGRKTERKKFAVKVKEMNIWLKSNRNILDLKSLWKTFCSKLREHFQYYGVSENTSGIRRFYDKSKGLFFKWVNRRSQKKSFNWAEFTIYIEKYKIPKPTIKHSFYFRYSN